MREYGFYDSPVMRELERQEIAKNGPDKPIKKAASIEPTDLLSKLANLSKNLRKSGKTEQADRLDYKVAMYVTAAEKNTHLYRTHDEEGEDLIEFAHPDGDVEICPSSGGYGKVETQLSQHKKIVDMVQKEPTGNYATASILKDVAGVLGLRKKAEVDPTINYNNNIAFVLENFSIAENWSDKPNFYFTGNFATGTKGIGFDTVGGGLGSNIVVVERGQELQENKYVWNIKEEYLYRQVLGGRYPDGAQASIETFEKDHNNLIRSSQVEFSKKLQEQKGVVNSLMIVEGTDIKQLDRCINELHRLRGGGQSEARGTTIESFGTSVWKLYFVKNERMLNTIVEAMGVALSEALKIRDVLGKMEEWAQWQNSNRYKQGYVKPTVGRILKAMNYFNVNSVEALVPKIQEQIDEYANKKASERFGLEKKAQNFDVGPETPPAATADTKPAPAPGGTGTRQPARRNLSNNEMQRRLAEIQEWQKRQPTEYWQDVITMQKQLHLLADSLSKQKLATNDQLNALRGTAIQYISNTGSFDYDGQWGPGTAKSLKMAKEILSTIQDGKFKTIADKIETGEPRGLLYDADTIELQNGIAGIAVNNANIISQIMSEAGINDSNVASGTVFDYVPKQWTQDLEFMLLNKETGIELKSGALSDLRSFSNWLNLNQIITNIKADSYEDSRFLIESLRALKQRADYLVKKQQAPQAYVDAIVALFNKASKDYNDWIRQNPRKGSPSVSDLEALTGSKSTSKTPGTSGSTGEGIDFQTGESSLIQRQVYELLNSTIIPKHIAQAFPDTNMAAGFDDILAGSIRRNTIETLVNNPEGLFTAIIDVREDNVPWSQILDETGYNHNSPALFFNGSGQAVNLEIANSKGERRTATMIQLDGLRGGRNSPPAQRIIREWRLNYLTRALRAIESDILKITMKVKQNYSDNVALINKIEDQKVSWVKAINKAIRSAEESLRGLRTGRGQKNWAW